MALEMVDLVKVVTTRTRKSAILYSVLEPRLLPVLLGLHSSWHGRWSACGAAFFACNLAARSTSLSGSLMFGATDSSSGVSSQALSQSSHHCTSQSSTVLSSNT